MTFLEGFNGFYNLLFGGLGVLTAMLFFVGTVTAVIFLITRIWRLIK